MNSTRTQASTNPKPVLHGVRIKQRKGVQKANAKHEPEIFRDQLLAQLKTIKEGDLEAVSSKLDLLGNTLEYRKYGDSLFEILITGGILEPGGIIDANVERSSFCLFAAEDDAAVIKKYVEVFNKLIRRYKYLQRIFGETLQNILQFINKWQPEENSKLAKSTGFFFCSQLVSASILKDLLQDYLVKDGHSLNFTTAVFRTVLAEQGMVQLGRMLATEKLSSRIIEFFPPNKRDEDCLVRHFEAEDMKELVEHYRIYQKNFKKATLLTDVSDLLNSESPSDVDVQKIIKKTDLSEAETVPIIWESIMSTVDLTSRPDQIGPQVFFAIKRWKEVLEGCCTEPKTEIVLLQKIQTTCYETTQLTKLFKSIVGVLYKGDILSKNAIIYWYEKAALGSGKKMFLDEMEKTVSSLKEEESEEEDSEEEDSD